MGAPSELEGLLRDVLLAADLSCVSPLFLSVSVFYQIGTQDDDQQPGEGVAEAEDDLTLARRAQEHEFRIGCVGVSKASNV